VVLHRGAEGEPLASSLGEDLPSGGHEGKHANNPAVLKAAERHDRVGYGHLQPGADHGVDPADAEDAVARGHQRAVS
jgi:hypothetical protein